jgi:hypothetical protein
MIADEDEDKFSYVYKLSTGLFEETEPPPLAVNGKFLLANLPNGYAVVYLNSSRIQSYNPENGKWGRTALAGNRAARLPGGSAIVLVSATNILIIGGGYLLGGTPKDTVDSWNPRTNVFTRMPNHMHRARFNHSATFLQNGHVLVSGGLIREDGRDRETRSCELYEISTSRWRPAGDLAVAREGHATVFLPSLNLVFLSGGTTNDAVNPEQYSTACELYTRETNAWGPGPELSHYYTRTCMVLLGTGADASTPLGEDD